MTNISVAPTSAKAGQVLDVDVWCVELQEKVVLTTVDAKNREVGFTTNLNRPLADGSMRVGIKAPPQIGPAKVRAYQLGKLVAECPLVVVK